MKKGELLRWRLGLNRRHSQTRLSIPGARRFGHPLVSKRVHEIGMKTTVIAQDSVLLLESTKKFGGAFVSMDFRDSYFCRGMGRRNPTLEDGRSFGSSSSI